LLKEKLKTVADREKWIIKFAIFPDPTILFFLDRQNKNFLWVIYKKPNDQPILERKLPGNLIEWAHSWYATNFEIMEWSVF